MQNSERGKKIGNVMVSTSRNVVQTGKAVGKKLTDTSFKNKSSVLRGKAAAGGPIYCVILGREVAKQRY